MIPDTCAYQTGHRKPSHTPRSPPIANVFTKHSARTRPQALDKPDFPPNTPPELDVSAACALWKGSDLSIWKQGLGLIMALVVIGFVAVAYFPGARSLMVDWGLLPASAQDAASAPAASTKAQGGGRKALVVLGAVTVATINDRLSALGIGVAVRSATLTPSESGILSELRLASGSAVKAGDVIAMLDPASAQVAYDAARIARDDAKMTLDRNQRLGTGSVVSATQLQAFQLAADKAELALRQAEIDLANRKIVSPIDGTLGILRVNAGVEVAQSTVIATVEDNSAIKVSYDLPERVVGKVKPGDTVSAIAIARPGNERVARVSAVDNRVDETTGSFEVEAIIPNEDGLLRAGMSFTITMQFAGDTYAAVPPLAVQWGAEGAYVWRVTESKVQRVPIRIVQRNAENVLVTGALAAGEAVVIEGLETLKDGAIVQVAGQPATDPASN